MRAIARMVITSTAGLALIAPASIAVPAQAETVVRAEARIGDMALRSMLLIGKADQQLSIIIPSSSATALADQGFDIGDPIGTLPFVTATATETEIESAARAGLAGGISLNRRVPKPQSSSIPDWYKDEVIDWAVSTGASKLHAKGFTGAGVGIAVIDDGIQASHPYFKDASGATRVVAQSCFVTLDYGTPSFPCPGGGASKIGPGAADVGGNTDFSHGTHVAGIAAGNAARASGAEGYTGMAPEAKLVISRVFGRGWANDSDIIEGMDWVFTQAGTHNIAAINLSLGNFQARYLDCAAYADSAYATVTKKLRAAGVAIIAASGNDGSFLAIGSPACATDWISVGATDWLGRVAWFSNISADIDILAPGDSLWSSVPVNSFDYLSGTSMASPVAAGAWGLMRQAVPAASGDAVLAAVRTTGPRIDDLIIKGLPTLRIDLAHDLLSNPFMPALPTNIRTTTLSATSIRVDWVDAATGARPTSYAVRVGGRTVTTTTNSVTLDSIGGSDLDVSVTAKTSTLNGPAVTGSAAFPVDEALPQVFDEAGTGFAADYCPAGGGAATLTYPAPSGAASRDIRVTAGSTGEKNPEMASGAARTLSISDADLADSLATRLQVLTPGGSVSEVQQIGDLVDLIPGGLPARPRSLSGSSTGTGISLTWAARGATQWRVLMDGFLAANVSEPQVTIPASLGTHEVTVCATGSGSSTSRAARTTVKVVAPPTPPTPAVPAAPTGVQATRTGTNVTLAWTAPAGPVVIYVVEAKFGTQWRVVGTRTTSPLSLTRAALGAATQMRVAAVNGAGQGPWSSAATIPR